MGTKFRGTVQPAYDPDRLREQLKTQLQASGWNIVRVDGHCFAFAMPGRPLGKNWTEDGVLCVREYLYLLDHGAALAVRNAQTSKITDILHICGFTVGWEDW